MTEITLNLTLEELKQIDKFVELNDETRPLFDKIQNAYPEPETLFDVIHNLGYSYDMCYEIVDAVEEFEKSKEPQRKIDSKNPPEFLKFELGKSLNGLIEEWWIDVFTRNSDLSMEESIDCLVTMISSWLPKEQSAKGTQNAYVECVVEGFNDCLNKIKSKLRNKKET